MTELITVSMKNCQGWLLGSTGFLPSRGSLMLDTVVCAMFLVLLVLGISIYLVRSRREYRAHRAIQISLALILAVTVIAFEIDIRFFTDWRSAAEQSPFSASGLVDVSLWVHLAFAIPTPFIWAYVLFGAVLRFRPPEPGSYSRFHRTWGWIASLAMLMTALTGWVFYYLAFVA
ncbi:MAG: DUF420 domain-containing protein [Mariniblastus sp.]|nr:DUF420 domain-containing protein [Mariniblastus sp.]